MLSVESEKVNNGGSAEKSDVKFTTAEEDEELPKNNMSVIAHPDHAEKQLAAHLSEVREGEVPDLVRDLPLSVQTVLSHSDMLSEILVRLPILSLALFKTVSKSWLPIITSSQFFECRSKINKIDSCAGFFNIGKDFSEPKYCFVSCDERFPSKREVTFETSPGFTNARILESCNGLLLCSVMPGRRFCIFNPTLHSYKMLPVPQGYKHEDSFVRLGFNPSTSPHYKVFLATRIPGPYASMFYRIQTYSSQTDIWSVVFTKTQFSRAFGDYYRDFEEGMYLNDEFYWLGSEMNLLKRARFVSEEGIVVDRIQLPATASSDDCCLYQSRGSLLLLAKDTTNRLPFNVYMMKNGQWLSKFYFNDPCYGGDRVWFISLGETEEDSFIVLRVDHHKAYLYNIGLKSFRELPLPRGAYLSMFPCPGRVNDSGISSYMFTPCFTSV